MRLGSQGKDSTARKEKLTRICRPMRASAYSLRRKSVARARARVRACARYGVLVVGEEIAFALIPLAIAKSPVRTQAA